MKALRIFKNGKSKDFLTCSRRFTTFMVNERASVPLLIRLQNRSVQNCFSPKQTAIYDKPFGNTFVRCFSSAELPQHYKIKLPALSPTMESGTLVQWLKKEGDTVSEGEPLCEIQTDKATMTFEAPEAGVLAKIFIPANTKDVPIGKFIAIIVPDAKSAGAFKDFVIEGSAAPPAQAPPTPVPQPEPTPAAAPPPSAPAAATSYPEHFKVKMPSLSPTMDSGTLMGWQKREGDEIKEGEVLCEVQTDKATMAFETPEAGFLAKILVPSNTPNVPIGKLICIITPKAGDIAAFKNFGEADAGAAPKAAAVSPAASAPAQPLAQPFSDKPQPFGVPGGPADKLRNISPLARRIAAEKGVNLANITGSGAGGLITSADVLKAAPAGAPAAAPRAAAPPPAPTAATTVAAAAPKVTPPPAFAAPSADYVDMPISQIRKVIAQRLVFSKQTIPHYYLTSDIEVDAVLKIRQELNNSLAKQAGKSGSAVKLSVNDFIIKAASLALRKIPECNSSWMESAGVIRKYTKVDMSVAVATDQGLITPIVFSADSKGLVEISTTVVGLAKKAREGRLQLNEFQGGTFTLSNLGMFGIREFAAVINPPQACILAVGAAQTRLMPVAGSDNADDEVRRANVMSVTLSCDHRVVDGAVGAAWLAEFKRLMENPSLMLL